MLHNLKSFSLILSIISIFVFLIFFSKHKFYIVRIDLLSALICKSIICEIFFHHVPHFKYLVVFLNP